MKILNTLGSTVLAALLILSIVACGDDSSGSNGGDPALSGTIIIYVDGIAQNTADPGKTLTAVYSGKESVSFQWNCNGSSINGETGDTFTPTEAGAYTVTVKASGYRSKTSAAVTIEMPQDPLTGNLSIRAGGSSVIEVSPNTELTAVYSGEEKISYRWYKNGAPINGATNATFTPTTIGTYTVTISASGYNSKSTSVEVIDAANLDGTIIIYGLEDAGTVIFNTELTAYYDGSEPGVSVRWYREGTEAALTAPETGTAKYTPMQPGVYYAIASLTGYIRQTSDYINVYKWVTVTLNPTGGNWNGDTNNKTEVIKSGLTVTDPGNPSQDRASFRDWKIQDGDIFNFSTPINEDTTLNARWHYAGPSPLTSLEDVAFCLGVESDGETMDDPVSLSVAIDLGMTNTEYTGWGQLLEAIGTADKYVNLDLSACTMTGTVFGYSPSNTAATGRNKILSFTFPAGVTSISYSIFYSCRNLTTVNIPETVTSIGNNAFWYCMNLTTINIPAGVTTIENSAFSYCSSLTTITIPAGITSIEENVFQGCSSLTTAIISEGVTTIKSYAFQDSGLTSVTIPSTVTSIGNYAFSPARNLTEIIMNPLSPPTVDRETFQTIASGAQMKVPAASYDAYVAAKGGSMAYWGFFPGTIVSQ